MDTNTQPARKLHFVVPCMGRLDFVKQTIEAALSQPGSTYTLVDYGCPQKSGEWVAANYPSARVVFAGSRNDWNGSEARNLGAKTLTDGWFCALDSDVLLHRDFSATVLATVQSGTYLRAPLTEPTLYGMLICSKADLDRCGGYDEITRSWGFEDIEIRMSLERIGLQAVELPLWLLKHIDHDDSLRAGQSLIKEKYYSSAINQLYAIMKDISLKSGVACNDAMRRRLYQFSKERFMLGFPWLSWPEAENPGEILPAVFSTLTRIGQNCARVADVSWGSARAFRIERVTDTPILELMTAYDRQTVTVMVPDRSALSVMNLVGEVISLPVTDGKATLELTGDPIFLLDEAELVKDVQISIVPIDGPAVNVELTPADGFSEIVDVEVCIGGQPPVRHSAKLADCSPVRFSTAVGLIGLELPQDVTITVTGGGNSQRIIRRTTFLTAQKLSYATAISVSPPDWLPQFHVDRQARWLGTAPNSISEPFNVSADVAWGWTDTALVCWIARRGASFMEGCMDSGGGIQIAAQPQNIHAPLAFGFQFTLCWRGGEYWVLLEKSLVDSPITLDHILIGEEFGGVRRMMIRLPFETLGMTPAAGDTIGLSMLFRDCDAEENEGWLAWGGGIAHGRNPRWYNEITLCDHNGVSPA